MKQIVDGIAKRWRQNRKKQTRAERLYGWRSGLTVLAIILVPQLINAWDGLPYKWLFIMAWMVIVCVLLFSRTLLPYQPVQDVRLRQLNVKVDWQQVYRWFKQKHVREVWGDPKLRLDEMLQHDAPGDEFIIQVMHASGWHEVGYVRVEPDQPTMIVVGEKYAVHQGVVEKVRALLPSEQGAAA